MDEKIECSKQGGAENQTEVFSTGTESSIVNDSLALQNIFPPELWEKICSNLDTPKEYINLCKASEYWKETLDSTKSSWLFGQVFPFLFSYLGNNETLTVREVCRLWKSSVDDFLQNIRFLDILKESSMHSYEINKPQLVSFEELLGFRKLTRQDRHGFHEIPQDRFYEFSDTSKIQTFQSKMDGHKGNPFVTRCVIFCPDPDQVPGEAEAAYWTETISFLKQFGQHVWYLQLILTPPLPLTHVMCILRGCLVHAPNLRGLCVNIGYSNFPAAEHEPERAIMEWKRRMEVRPLPDLPKLELLQILDVLYYEFSLVEDVTKFPSCYYKGLKNLLVINYQYLKSLHQINQNTFPNLSEMTIFVKSPTCLENLGKIKSPVKRVNLSVSYGAQISFRDILARLSSFGESLVEVIVKGGRLSRRFHKHNDQDDREIIPFPKLRVLEISPFYGELVNDLELISASLPKFYLGLKMRASALTGDGDISDLEYSIWNTMPSLRKLRCRGYSRSDREIVDRVTSRQD